MNPPTFKTLREQLGVEQEWLANQLGVNIRSVKRWEKTHQPPPEAYELLAGILEQWIGLADKTIDEIDAEPTPPEQVDLTRYLNEESYLRAHPESSESWSMHTAKIRYFYTRLIEAGYDVVIHFAPVEP